MPAVTRTTLNACRWWALDRQTDALTCRGATVGVLWSGESDAVHPTSQSVVGLLNFLPKPKVYKLPAFLIRLSKEHIKCSGITKLPIKIL